MKVTVFAVSLLVFLYSHAHAQQHKSQAPSRDRPGQINIAKPPTEKNPIPTFAAPDKHFETLYSPAVPRTFAVLLSRLDNGPANAGITSEGMDEKRLQPVSQTFTKISGACFGGSLEVKFSDEGTTSFLMVRTGLTNPTVSQYPVLPGENRKDAREMALITKNNNCPDPIGSFAILELTCGKHGVIERLALDININCSAQWGINWKDVVGNVRINSTVFSLLRDGDDDVVVTSVFLPKKKTAKPAKVQKKKKRSHANHK